MRSGNYRHRIDLQHKVLGDPDPLSGHQAEGWESFTTQLIPAEVLTGPGRELRAAGAEHAETDARINFRWLPGVTQQMRVVWDGKTYNITGIEYDATARREIRLTCVEGRNDG